MPTPLEKEIEQALGSLRFPGNNQSGSVEKDGNHWSRDFRVYEYFTPRTREEYDDPDDFDGDDDWPNFTGSKKVHEIVQKHFAALIKKGCTVNFDASEKSWFAVHVEAPKKG